MRLPRVWSSTPDLEGDFVTIQDVGKVDDRHRIAVRVRGAGRNSITYLDHAEVPALIAAVRAVAGLPEVIEIPVEELPEVSQRVTNRLTVPGVANPTGLAIGFSDWERDSEVRHVALAALAILRFREQERAEKASKDAERAEAERRWLSWFRHRSGDEYVVGIHGLAKEMAACEIPVPQERDLTEPGG